ncbi:hypothetical protein [Streptomyces sp. R08]|uniref:Uncharacterized protein n=1 Tax=Streptomyces sp. R08 TaxID=3238624 RepID=A0AB39MDV7_9ACTN
MSEELPMWESVFTAEGLRRVWHEERHPTIANMILNTDCDEKGEVTEAGYDRIAAELNNLAELTGQRGTANSEQAWSVASDSEQTWAVAYAVRNTLATLVQQITEARTMLASDEGKAAPGAIRKSLENLTREQEQTYRGLVRTFATLPEEIRPDMRTAYLKLPEVDKP